MGSISNAVINHLVDTILNQIFESEYEKEFEEIRKDIGEGLGYAEPFYSEVISPDHARVKIYMNIKQQMMELSARFQYFLERYRDKKKVKGLLLKKMMEVPNNLLNIANNMISKLILSSDILKEKSLQNKEWAYAVKCAIGIA